MRLCERTLVRAELAPRIHVAGALGGIGEQFSDERTILRASLLPEEGELSAEERGAVGRERVRLLVPSDAPGSVGDGVWVKDGLYRILSIQRWTAHMEWICGAV